MVSMHLLKFKLFVADSAFVILPLISCKCITTVKCANG